MNERRAPPFPGPPMPRGLRMLGRRRQQGRAGSAAPGPYSAALHGHPDWVAAQIAAWFVGGVLGGRQCHHSPIWGSKILRESNVFGKNRILASQARVPKPDRRVCSEHRSSRKAPTREKFLRAGKTPLFPRLFWFAWGLVLAFTSDAEPTAKYHASAPSRSSGGETANGFGVTSIRQQITQRWHCALPPAATRAKSIGQHTLRRDSKHPVHRCKQAGRTCAGVWQAQALASCRRNPALSWQNLLPTSTPGQQACSGIREQMPFHKIKTMLLFRLWST